MALKPSSLFVLACLLFISVQVTSVRGNAHGADCNDSPPTPTPPAYTPSEAPVTVPSPPTTTPPTPYTPPMVAPVSPPTVTPAPSTYTPAPVVAPASPPTTYVPPTPPMVLPTPPTYTPAPVEAPASPPTTYVPPTPPTYTPAPVEAPASPPTYVPTTEQASRTHLGYCVPKCQQRCKIYSRRMRPCVRLCTQCCEKLNSYRCVPHAYGETCPKWDTVFYHHQQRNCP